MNAITTMDTISPTPSYDGHHQATLENWLENALMLIARRLEVALEMLRLSADRIGDGVIRTEDRAV